MKEESPATFTGVLSEEDEIVTADTIQLIDKKEFAERGSVKMELIWTKIIGSIIIHSCGLYTAWQIITFQMALRTVIVIFAYGLLCNIGVAGGAHRLWSHRGYKAKLPLRLFLLFWQTLSGQNSLYAWVRDHRVHHKFAETNADPHNIKRGFFFAHTGWLLCRKHPDVTRKGQLLDLSDLESDPIIMWQHRHFYTLVYLTVFTVPTLVVKALTYETWWSSFLYGALGRYSVGLNLNFLINSYAHYYGNKPYDVNLQATDSFLLGYCGLGEGWHNYHHTFPWDYRASEFRFFRGFNFTTLVIDFFALLGLAYDLKTVSPEVIKARALRTGDGTHNVWGWGDKDIPKEHIQSTIVINRSKTTKDL